MLTMERTYFNTKKNEKHYVKNLKKTTNDKIPYLG